MTTPHITIVEVGPRDGLQNEATLVSTDAKIAYIDHLVSSGVRRIEATSFVHPRLVPQMADAEEVMRRVPRREGLAYIGLVLNERGLNRAIDAGVDEVNIVIVATETFSQRNQNMSVADSLVALQRMCSRALAQGLGVTATIAVSFGCPFEGEVPPDVIQGLAARCADAGVSEVALADTIGVATPRDVRERLEMVRASIDLPLRAHFHNTRNTGYANALAAIDAGVTSLDASAGGIGGCPFAPNATGNIATEDLLYALERSGFATDIKATALLDSSAYIERELGKQNPALLGRAGWFPPPPARN